MKMLCIAGFGDNASMFSALLETELTAHADLIPMDLPGFGAPAQHRTTLASMAEFVAETSRQTGATAIMAHSVASITASLAAAKPDCPLNTVISLEGNLTAPDAYFSGTAADYDGPDSFRPAFLARLKEMAKEDPIIDRYRKQVMTADPKALWELGCDARTFCTEHHPGEMLGQAGDVLYVYNPDNCAQSSLDWLASADFASGALPGASHWPSINAPEKLSKVVLSWLQAT